MAQNGVRSRSENRPKTVPVQGKPRMPNREHPTVEAMQTTSEYSAINGAL